MTIDVYDRPCITRRGAVGFGHRDPDYLYTVREYEEVLGERHDQPLWARRATPAAGLQHSPEDGDPRVCDREAYEAQMRRSWAWSRSTHRPRNDCFLATRQRAGADPDPRRPHAAEADRTPECRPPEAVKWRAHTWQTDV